MFKILYIFLIFILFVIIILLIIYIIIIKKKNEIEKLLLKYKSNLNDVKITFKNSHIYNNDLYIKPFANKYEILKFIALNDTNTDEDYINLLNLMVNYELLDE